MKERITRTTRQLPRRKLSTAGMVLVGSASAVGPYTHNNIIVNRNVTKLTYIRISLVYFARMRLADCGVMGCDECNPPM